MAVNLRPKLLCRQSDTSIYQYLPSTSPFCAWDHVVDNPHPGAQPSTSANVSLKSERNNWNNWKIQNSNNSIGNFWKWSNYVQVKPLSCPLVLLLPVAVLAPPRLSDANRCKLLAHHFLVTRSWWGRSKPIKTLKPGDIQKKIQLVKEIKIEKNTFV